MSLSRNRWLGLASITLVLGGAVALACGGDDTTTPVAAKDAGKETAPPADTGPRPVEDTGTPDTGPADTGPMTTLYQRLGMHDGIKMLVNQAITEILKDPQQASYFVFQKGDAGSAGHPTRGDIEECFTDFVGANTMGPETYPPAPLPSGFQCRSMKDAHTALHIPNAVFAEFVGLVLTVATAKGVAAADITQIFSLLDMQRASIIDPARGDGGGYFEGGPASDSGTDASSDASDASDGSDAG